MGKTFFWRVAFRGALNGRVGSVVVEAETNRGARNAAAMANYDAAFGKVTKVTKLVA